MATIKAIVFVRVSSNAQDLVPQRIEVLDYAKRFYAENEIAIVEGKESAIKLSEEKRQTLNEMKELIDKYPTVEQIFCFALDRISRRCEVTISVIAFLTERSINLTFLNPQLTSTMIRQDGKLVENQTAKLFILFMSYGAEQEMKIKSERFRAAKSKLLADGKLPQGETLYGYFRDNDGNLCVDPDGAKVVRYIYHMYLDEGVSLARIYERLVNEGYWTTAARKCSFGSRIRKFFTAPAYIGKDPKYNYPPIVTEEMQEQAKLLLADGKKRSRKTNNTYYGRGLMVGYFPDGREYHFGMNRAVASYQIRKLDEPQYTMTVSVNAADFFLWECTKIIFPLEQYAKSKAGKSDLLQRIKEVNENLKRMDCGIAEVQKRIDRTTDFYIYGKMSKERHNEIYTELQRQIEAQVKIRQAELEKKAGLEAALESMGDSNLPPFESIECITDDEQRIRLIKETIGRCEVRLSDGVYELRVIPRADLVGKYDPANYVCTYYSRGGYLNLFWNGVNCRESIPIRMKSKYRGRKKVRVDTFDDI